MRHELLVPAGNMECLIQAIHNGADAIYAGCKDFGARKFANNFTNEEIVTATKLCHLYGVKIYITMNTLIKDREVNDFLKQIEFLHKTGIDAVLIQDFGMLCLIREMFPNLEVHASTQANVSLKETVELYHKLGVKRIVFPREMTIEEIESINVPIEKEIFIHGALCVSYSGCCLMSSMIGGRSGNRGECSGSCRLKYSLLNNNKIIKKDKYLLSCKELNTSRNFNRLINSNITSFKIEGRMKSPEYVGFITNYYRKLLDKKDIDLDAEEDKLKTIYNREFTSGHLFDTSSDLLLNIDNPNHIGLRIGKVIKVTNKKIYIKLDKGREINQFDAIRFLTSKTGFIINYLYDKKDNLINYSNDMFVVDKKVDACVDEIVTKTLDNKLIENLKRIELKKIDIDLKLIINKQGKLELQVNDIDNNHITIEGNIVEEAKSMPITKERIYAQLIKLGNTPFKARKVTIDIGNNKFIAIGELNRLRQSACELLVKEREKTKIDYKKCNVNFSIKKEDIKREISISVINEEQLKSCLKYNIDRIYIKNKELYEKYKDLDNVYYIHRRNDLNLSKNLYKKNVISECIENNSNRYIIGNYGINVFNSYTLYYLKKIGFNNVCISVELTKDDILELIDTYKKKFKVSPKLEVLIYGRVENMIIKGNILDIEKDSINYQLLDIHNYKFPVYYDGLNTIIYNYTNHRFEDIFSTFECVDLRLDFYDEPFTVVEDILTKTLLKFKKL